MICSYCKKEFKKVTKSTTCSKNCRLMDGIKISENDCWEWQKAIVNGYGKLRFKNKFFSVHRVSYEMFKGEISKGFFVCHSCDNKKCVNPGHLWLGTHEDNMKDASKKGRMIGTTGQKLSKETKRKISLNHADFKGEKSCRSKLKDKDVYAIKELLKTDMTLKEIGSLYGVSKHAIHNIKTGKRWRHL